MSRATLHTILPPNMPTTSSSRGGGGLVALARGRGTAGLEEIADKAGADLGGGLVEGEGDVGELGGVADEAGVRVARNVGPPLPRRRVRVPRPHVLRLQPLQLLLRA